MVRHAASSWLVDVNPQISWEEPSRATTPLREDGLHRPQLPGLRGSSPQLSVPVRFGAGLNGAAQAGVGERGLGSLDADDGATLTMAQRDEAELTGEVTAHDDEEWGKATARSRAKSQPPTSATSAAASAR